VLLVAQVHESPFVQFVELPNRSRILHFGGLLRCLKVALVRYVSASYPKAALLGHDEGYLLSAVDLPSPQQISWLHVAANRVQMLSCCCENWVTSDVYSDPKHAVCVQLNL
jgi:hypothetical protein